MNKTNLLQNGCGHSYLLTHLGSVTWATWGKGQGKSHPGFIPLDSAQCWTQILPSGSWCGGQRL